MNTDSRCQPRVPLILNLLLVAPPLATLPVGKCSEASRLDGTASAPTFVPTAEPHGPNGSTRGATEDGRSRIPDDTRRPNASRGRNRRPGRRTLCVGSVAHPHVHRDPFGALSTRDPLAGIPALTPNLEGSPTPRPQRRSERNHDRSVSPRPPDRRPSGSKSLQHFKVRQPPPRMTPCRHDGNHRIHCVEESAGRGSPTRVVGDLQDVRAQVHSAVEKHGLGANTDIARQQDRQFLELDPHHQRTLVARPGGPVALRARSG